MTIVGQRIKERRLELKLSQRELSDRMGYSNHSTIARVENGSVDLPLTRVQQFAEVLGTTPSYLMGWEEATETEIKNSDAKADITNRILEDDEFFALVDKLNRLDRDQLQDAEKLLDLLFKQILDQQKD